MFQKIKKRLSSSNKVAGITIKLKGASPPTWNMLVLEKKQDSIDITARITTKIGLENLSQQLEQNIPLAVNLIGKGIIHKQLNPFPTSPQDAFQQALPNAVVEDFIYQIDEMDAVYWISIIRKKVLEDIVRQLEKQGFSVLNLRIGLMGIRHVFPLIQALEPSLHVAQYSFSIEQNNIHQFTKLEVPSSDVILIGAEPLANEFVFSFAIAFQTLLDIPVLLFNTLSIQEAQQNYFYKNVFKLLGWTFLMGSFLVLLLNFAAFSWLNQQNQQLSNELLHHQQQLEQLNHLKQQYQTKQVFFAQNNVLKASKISYYLDRIGQSIPKEIQLTNMLTFPPIGKTKKERQKAVRFQSETIRTKGFSQKSIFLNQWIKTLEQLNWVQQVKVLPYAEQSDGTGAFELEILIKDEKK